MSVRFRARSIATEQVIGLVIANQCPPDAQDKEFMEMDFTLWLGLSEDHIELEEVSDAEWKTDIAFDLFPIYRISVERKIEFLSDDYGVETGVKKGWSYRFVKA